MQDFLKGHEAIAGIVGGFGADFLADFLDGWDIYRKSIFRKSGLSFFLGKADCGTKALFVLITGETLPAGLIEDGSISTNMHTLLRCPLSIANAYALIRNFPELGPRSMTNSKASIGMGDRLGFVTPGHVKAIQKTSAFPIFAQQSIRELNLTGRTFEDVLSDALWGALQEGWHKGFGADGDHLKTEDEVAYALRCGYSMITLDCSNHIGRPEAASNRQGGSTLTVVAGKAYRLADGTSIAYDDSEISRIRSVYQSAVDFSVGIYNEFLVKHANKIDFELSIDETSVPTDNKAHYFVAKQLYDAGVVLTSMAPRFIGEFQKGIDYIGKVDCFRNDFTAHQAIADTFGYKLSVHSGSDKFSIYPSVAELSKGRFHLKTAGTNWLEAIRAVFAVDPNFFQEMYSYAREHLNEAKAYYKVNVDADSVPEKIDFAFFDRPDIRQMMHITYGVLLNATSTSGKHLFRNRLYSLMAKNEGIVDGQVEKHMASHLISLGLIDRS